LNYFPLTDQDRKAMREVIGIKETRELFSDLPADPAYFPLDDLPPALAENRLLRDFQDILRKNTFPEYTSFLGAGAYDHFIPEVVNHLSSRGEFVTPYTPYQPEASQGSLQALFEYQTMLCMLTGLDIANSSLYDGGTAAAEAVLLAMRFSRNKKRCLVAENIHPEYRSIIETYLQNLDARIDTVPFSPETGKIKAEDLRDRMGEDVAGFLFQSPNFLGVIEDSREISDIVHQFKKASSIQIVAEALSLPLLVPPAQGNVDIVAGEAQSFGLPLWYGGPYLGFMSTRKEYLRQLPGRIVGQTRDREGNPGYVLTLSTREQHIRREKATSNICTNQAWCALRAAIYLSTMGRRGLSRIARINHQNTAYFIREAEKLHRLKVRYRENIFNEVVLSAPPRSVDRLFDELKSRKILAGIKLAPFFPQLADSLLLNFTEKHTKEDIDRLIQALGGFHV